MIGKKSLVSGGVGFALTLPFIAYAAGIQVSPASLKLALNGKGQTETITIANPTTDVQIFEVSVDEFEDIIKISPSSFTLEAGGRKKVLISFENKQQKNQKIISTNISVLSKPLMEEKFSVNTGVKIPITITSNNNQLLNFDYEWLIIGFLLILIIVFINRQQSRSL